MQKRQIRLTLGQTDGRMSYWDGSNRVYVTRDNAEEVGRILLEENVRSANYRYGGRIGDDEKNAAALYCFTYAAPASVAGATYQGCALS